jgi:hypothetical protein
VTVIVIDHHLPGGTIVPYGEVVVELKTGAWYGGAINGTIIAGKYRTTLDASGYLEIDLEANEDMDTPDTVWKVDVAGDTWYIDVPNSGGPYGLGHPDIQAYPPPMRDQGPVGPQGPPGDHPWRHINEFGDDVEEGVEDWADAPIITGHIVNALAAMHRGEVLYIPAGFYQSDPFTIVTPIGLVGDGQYATRLGPTAGSTGSFVTVDHSTEYAQVGHTDGLNIHDLFLDGRGRTVDCAGLELVKQNRGGIRQVRIAHFARQALIMDDSNRELVFSDLYLRHCGDGQTYPQWQINSTGVGDDTNNLYLYGIESVHPHGDNLWVRPDDATGDSTRNLYIFGLMIHGIATAIGDPTPEMDGYQYTVTPEMRGGTQLTVTGIRSLFIFGMRNFSAQYGMPNVRLVKLADGSSPTEVNVHLIGGNISGPRSLSFTFTADAGTDSLTAVDHGLVTGARVRVSNSGGALPAPLVAATDYFAIKVDDDTLQLASTWRDAQNGVEVALSDAGTGTHTCSVNLHHHHVEFGNLFLSHCDHDGAPTDGSIQRDDLATCSVEVGSGCELSGGRAFPSGQTQPMQHLSADLEDDFELTTDTLTLVPGLTVSRLKKNSKHRFTAQLFLSGDLDADVSVAFVLPTGSTIKWSALGLIAAATTVNTVPVYSTVVGSGTERAFGILGTQTAVTIHGRFETSSTAGDFQVWARQNVADATPSVVELGSGVEITRIT